MLARKFSAVWIAEHAADLLAEAQVEYAEWLEDHPPARKPVGWVLTCAYRRALNLLDAETRKPPIAPLDSIFHLPDESTPTPEQVALDNDLQSRLRDAISHLPAKEAKLLTLIYYKGYSIREAGRELGWRKSAADRHHAAAMEKMLALVGDRRLLSSATLALATSASPHGDARPTLDAAAAIALRPLLHAYAIASEAAETAAHRAADLARRLTPFSDPATAAATRGAGRVAAQCGAAAGIAVCSLLAAPAVQQGLSDLGRGRPAHSPAPRIEPHPARHINAPTSHSRPSRSDSIKPTRANAANSAPRREQRARASNPPPRATGHQSSSEFGDNNIEHGATEAQQTTESAPAPAPPPRADHGKDAPSSRPEFGL